MIWGGHTTISYLNSFQARISNLSSRVSKCTSWAESSYLGAKVVSVRAHQIRFAQDSAQDFAQDNSTYLSAKWWINIDSTKKHDDFSRDPRSSFANYSNCSNTTVWAEISNLFHKTISITIVLTEISNLDSQGQQNHDRPIRNQQSSLTELMYWNHDNPTGNQLSGFAKAIKITTLPSEIKI